MFASLVSIIVISVRNQAPKLKTINFMKNENTQHTPAPWKIKTAGTFDKAGIIGQVRLPSEKGKYWITIAECDYDAYIKGISSHQTDHHKRSNDVAFLRSLQQANAQLITSAPELLEALKMCLPFIEEELQSRITTNGSLGILGDAVRLSRSAIAKAEGKS